jgi:hypothetical protein
MASSCFPAGDAVQARQRPRDAIGHPLLAAVQEAHALAPNPDGESLAVEIADLPCWARSHLEQQVDQN